MRTACLAAAAITMFTASRAFADDAVPAASPPDHAIELGVGIGQSSLRVSSPEIAGSGTINATGYKAFVGYRFSKYITAEAAYMDGGTLTEKADTERLDIHPRIEQVSMIGSYPVLRSVAVFGRIGVDHWDSHLTVSDSTLGKADLSGSDTDFAWGAGLQAYMDRALVRIEYEQMQTSQNLAGVLPVDFRHRFIAVSVVWLL